MSRGRMLVVLGWKQRGRELGHRDGAARLEFGEM
jgi:hypothetical protein